MDSPDATPTEQSRIAEIRGLIRDGQYFLAYDRYLGAISEFPASTPLALLGALSLLRGGAIAEAQRLVTSFGDRLATRTIRKQRLVESLRRGLADDADDAAIDALMRAIRDAATGDLAMLDDVDTLRLAVELHENLWEHTGDDALLGHARALAHEAFAQSRALADGLSAATLDALAGHPDRASDLARMVADLADVDAPSAETLLIRGQAAVLLGEREAARAAFERANAPELRQYPATVRVLQRLDALQTAGVDVPDDVRAPLAPPVTTIFAGQPVDAPGVGTASCPPWAEQALADEISRRIDALGVEIGYARAHPGSDLLFIEALLDRGAEVHVFLPFETADFVQHCVAYAGRTWVRRFHNAMKLATSVTVVTEEQYHGHDALFRFNNHVVKGMALWQSEFHFANLNLMIAWDYMADHGEGSVSDFMDDWPDITRLHLIDLEDIRACAGETGRATTPADAQPDAGSAPATPAVAPARVIRTMLFADIEKFTRLRDGELPAFLQVLGAAREHTRHEHQGLSHLETWGDAIYAVHESALGILAYTFALQQFLATLDTAAFGLSQPIRLRMGLHAGPVYEGIHPLNDRPVVYGSHVSRAARIEPISVADHVYASQQFVAMLMSEDNSARHAALSVGEPYTRQFVCEYMGTLALPKGYGRQAVYHVRRPHDAIREHRANDSRSGQFEIFM